MIINYYLTLDEMKKLCGDDFHIDIIHIIGRDGIIRTMDDLYPSLQAVYAYEVEQETHRVSIYVGMNKKKIQSIIDELRPLHGSFNAVSVEEMVEYFHSINDALQFIECGKRAGLLESCGEGFYAF